MKRSTLRAMQLVGAVTLLAYPLVLIGLLAGESRPSSGLEMAVTGVFFIGALLYPVIWGVLWFWSWKAFNRGQPKLAALLSAPPLLVLAATGGLVMAAPLYEAWRGNGYLPNQGKEFKRVEAINPLLADTMRYENWELSYAEFDAAIRRADTQHLSMAVEVRRPTGSDGVLERTPNAGPERIIKRTPLGFLLEHMVFGPGSLDFDPTTARPHYIDFARLMIARGATLSPDEINDNSLIKIRLDAIVASTPPEH